MKYICILKHQILYAASYSYTSIVLEIRIRSEKPRAVKIETSKLIYTHTITRAPLTGAEIPSAWSALTTQSAVVGGPRI